MAWFVVAVAGGSAIASIGSGVAQGVGAGKAAGAQKEAGELSAQVQREALQEQKRQFEILQGMLAPYAGAGNVALDQMGALLGLDKVITNTVWRQPEKYAAAGMFAKDNIVDIIEQAKILGINRNEIADNAELLAEKLDDRVFAGSLGGEAPFINARTSGAAPAHWDEEAGRFVRGGVESGGGSSRFNSKQMGISGELRDPYTGEVVAGDNNQMRPTIFGPMPGDWNLSDMNGPRKDAPRLPDSDAEPLTPEGRADFLRKAFQTDTTTKTLDGDALQRQAIGAIRRSSQFREGVKQGERGILSNASATGGLRGGDTQAALAQFRPAMLNSLIQQRLGQLGGIAAAGQNAAAGIGAGAMNVGAMAGQGANAMSNIFQQQGDAAAQNALAQAQAVGSGFNSLGGSAAQIGTLGLLKKMNIF